MRRSQARIFCARVRERLLIRKGIVSTEEKCDALICRLRLSDLTYRLSEWIDLRLLGWRL
jgi:hypothetical protein